MNVAVDGGNALQLLVLITGITLVPALLFTVTGFTRILIVLGFIRQGLGTPTAPPNQVLVGIALVQTYAGESCAPEVLVQVCREVLEQDGLAVTARVRVVHRGL